MWNEESTNSYEGLFSPAPDRVDHGIWGTVEIHDRTIAPNIEVSHNWYGHVTHVDTNWLY